MATTIIPDSVGNTTAVLTRDQTGAVLIGNNANDVLVAAGELQSIAGGTGTNEMWSIGLWDSISAQGIGDTLIGGEGPSTFALAQAASHDMLYGELGAASIVDAGSDDTIVGSAAGTFLSPGGQTEATLGGTDELLFAEGLTFVTDAGTADTIVGGYPGREGAPMTWVTLSGHNAVAFGGLGASEFADQGMGDTIVAGAGNTAVSSEGGTTFFGSSGTFSFMDQSTAGSTIVSGSGAGTITGSSGSDLIVFFSAVGGANDVVNGMTGNDLVLLSGYGGSAASAALDTAASSSAGTTITLSDNTRITFTGLSVDQLTGHIVST